MSNIRPSLAKDATPEQKNAYYRAYRRKNRSRLRAYHRTYMRKFRRAKRREAMPRKAS
jgi:hypothetical protein